MARVQNHLEESGCLGKFLTSLLLGSYSGVTDPLPINPTSAPVRAGSMPIMVY